MAFLNDSHLSVVALSTLCSASQLSREDECIQSQQKKTEIGFSAKNVKVRDRGHRYALRKRRQGSNDVDDFIGSFYVCS